MLTDLLKKRGQTVDFQFDWVMKKAKLFIDPSEYAGYHAAREKEFGELGKMELGV